MKALMDAKIVSGSTRIFINDKNDKVQRIYIPMTELERSKFAPDVVNACWLIRIVT